MKKSLLFLFSLLFSGLLVAQDCENVFIGIDSYLGNGGPAFVEWNVYSSGNQVTGGVAQFSMNDPFFDTELCLEPGCYEIIYVADQIIEPNAFDVFVDAETGWINNYQLIQDGDVWISTFCLEPNAECDLDVVVTDVDCAATSFQITNIGEGWWGWFVNGELVQDNIPDFILDPEAPGVYVVEVIFESPECPFGAQWVWTVEVGEDCFGTECDVEILIDDNGCGNYAFVLSTNNSNYDVYWSLNGQPLDVPNDQYIVFVNDLVGDNTICADLSDGEGCELLVCEDFFSEECETICTLDVTMDEVDCSTYVFTAEASVEAEIFWTVNNDIQQIGDIFTFQAEEPGAFQVCAFFETPECPLGEFWCESVFVSEDCVGESCDIEVSYEQVECGAFYFSANAPDDAYIYWYVDGELTLDGVVGLYVPFGTEGIHTVCAQYDTDECGGHEDCVSVEVEGCEATCTEVTATFNSWVQQGGPLYVDWTLYDAEENELDGSIIQFSPNDPSASLDLCLDAGCYILEIFDPNGQLSPNTFSASLGGVLGNYEATVTVNNENYIVYEICVDATLVWPEDDCPGPEMYAAGDCLEWEFEIGSFQEGEVAIWDFGDGTVIEGGHYITHEYPEPGNYEVCVFFTSDVCEGVTVCQPIEVQDCWNDCPDEYIWSNGECLDWQFEIGSFQEGEMAIWDFGDGTVEQGGHFIPHTYEEPGVYTVCVEYWSNECPGVFACQTIEVESCQCPNEIIYYTADCLVELIVLDADPDAEVVWYAGNEVIEGGPIATWIVEQGGLYDVCAYYTDENCEGIELCMVVDVEDCEGGGDCTLEGEVDVVSCNQAIVSISGDLPWNTVPELYVDGEYQYNGMQGSFILEEGWHTICALFESDQCNEIIEWCDEFYIEGCSDCLEGISANVNGCLVVFEALVNDFGQQVNWYIGDEVFEAGPVFTWEAPENGTYVVCASLPGQECDIDEVCEIVEISNCGNDCFISLSYQQTGEQTYVFTADAPDNATVYWTVNGMEAGEPGNAATFTFEEFGQYEVCASYFTEECGELWACVNILVAPQIECTPVTFYIEGLEDIGVDVDIQYLLEGLDMELEGWITLQEECGIAILELCIPNGCYALTLSLEEFEELGIILAILADQNFWQEYDIDFVNQTVTVEFSVNDDCTTGVGEMDAADWLVYPNPATDRISVAHDFSPEANWTLTDITGRVIDQGLFTQSLLTIDTGSLSAGTYLLMARDQGRVSTTQVQIVK